MLRAAIAFFVLALVAMALGASGFAGMSADLGRTLLTVFIVLAVISFLANLLTGRKTNINSFAWIALVPVAAMMFGCSSTPKSETAKVADKAMSAPAPKTVTAARQAGSSNVSEVNFDKGSFALSEGSRAALRDMVNGARNTGNIDDIKVLAWADVDYPSTSKKSLTSADRQLARKRAEAIRDYVKSELAVKTVDTYNMAERPNTIQKMFNTSDARVKSAFENAGVTSADGRSITGKASHAVVMAMLKQ